VVAFLRPRGTSASTSDTDSIIEAGPVSNFERESVTAFVLGKFYLCRLKDGGFLAISRRCTHLGCTVPWVETEKAFACPCHASTFNIKGEVQSAPAPRPLDLYRVYIENDIVKVDTRTINRRGSFRLEQVVYPRKV
jgi:cytochrome b6-f complex iron-sulfur subunit